MAALALVVATSLPTLPGPVRAQPDAASIRAQVAEAAPGAIELFRSYLAIPNDAVDRDGMAAVADWVEEAFTRRGFAVRRLETPRLPLLLAERRVAEPVATVLVYLQADGQPVDPSAWDQPDPYVAALKEPDGTGGWRAVPWSRLEGSLEGLRIFARSASDSKGPNVQFLTALDLLDRRGTPLDYDLKVVIDLEEEMGSPNLPAAVDAHREALSADMLVIFDGPPHYSGRPTLTFGARGIATATLTAYGPRVPQHSGHYGNFVPNPAQALAHLLASMEDEEGRVLIPGFYDGITLDDETRRILDDVPDDEAEILATLGIAESESVGRSLQEAVQYPSLNVRGLSAGWVGDQARTIIPATAVAELDVRLVRESDGEHLLDLIRRHARSLGWTVLEGRDPTEQERRTHPRLLRFDGTVAYAAYRTDFESVPGRWLDAGMRRLLGSEPVKIRTSGGSIPISPFVTTLGVPAVSVPTVNPDNNQHSPNENLRVDTFVEGIAVVMSVLSEPLGPFLGPTGGGS